MSVSAPSGQFFSLADLGLPTSTGQFMALWQNAMQTAFPGYVPNPASLEYIQAQVFASWAADLAQLASAGSMELFRQFGGQLLGLPYQQGTPALAIATVTATDTAGHTLPQGTQFTLTLSGALIAFATVSTLTISAGSSSGQVTLAAVQSGTAYNGAAAPISLASQIDWVSSVALVTVASGGVDQETDDAYVQRLAQTLTTLGYATATATALATRAFDFIPASGTDQEAVGRSTAIDGYSPSNAAFTVTTTNSSPNLTVTGAPTSGTATVLAAPGASLLGSGLPSATFTATTTSTSPVLSSVSSFSNITEDALISGTGIPAGTSILGWIDASGGTHGNTAGLTANSQALLSANATATGSGVTITVATAIVNSSTSTSIVMSANATASATGVTATVAGTDGNERTATVCVTDASGNALNSDTMTAVGSYLAGFREANFVINTVSPAYSTIYVTVTVSAQPGFATATVQANVQAALLAYLSPANFGLPQGAIQGWQNTQTVYRSAVTAIIQNTLGVAYVHAGTLAIGLAASPSNTTTDVVLPGAFPLPSSTSTSIPTSAITVS